MIGDLQKAQVPKLPRRTKTDAYFFNQVSEIWFKVFRKAEHKIFIALDGSATTKQRKLIDSKCQIVIIGESVLVSIVYILVDLPNLETIV